MIAPTLIYHAVLPQMVERRNGLMLVMASASNMRLVSFSDNTIEIGI